MAKARREFVATDAAGKLVAGDRTLSQAVREAAEDHGGQVLEMPEGRVVWTPPAPRQFVTDAAGTTQAVAPPGESSA